MGAMKAYLMWLEEKGYIELVPTPNGDDEYKNTNTHPGEATALQEYRKKNTND